ncbi:hypothetical protein V8D89_011756 [Ganoderma adspersum]
MAPNPNDQPAKKSPRPPFDDEDADIIFRSSNKVDFRLYKVVLAKVSPVFRTMLQPSQSSSTPTAPSAPDEPHVIELTEHSRTLESLLRLCYPVEHPDVTSLGEVKSILEAAQKYEIACVIANLRWVITRILPKDPLRFYAIAYMLKMEDVAKKAANLLLDDPQFHIPSSPPPEFHDLPCVAIYLVHTYRQKCVEAVLRVLADLDWSSQSWVWMTCKYGHPSTAMRTGSKTVTVRKWFEGYLDSLNAALRVRPSGRTVRSFPTSAEASAALSETAPCSNCASKAHADVTHFSEWLVDKVDNAVAKVVIDFPFSASRLRRQQEWRDMLLPT